MKLSDVLMNALLSLGLLSLSGCTKTPEWTLFYYPNSSPPTGELLTDHINGYYETLEQCQTKAHGMLRLSHSGVSGAGAYQCGHQCQFNDKSVLICQSLDQ